MTVARFAAVVALALATCTPVATADPVRLPPDTGAFDYQLGGPSDTPGLTVVARDATEYPLEGAYNICYVNGFQTQPGDGADWLAHHGGAVLRDASGAPVVDPDWPDEYVLDPSTPAQRTTILGVLGPVLDGCAQRGFEAVEIDNLDTFTRFPAVDEDGAFELASAYAALAHSRGMAIGQKNAAEYVASGRGAGFDFAVAEECAAYDECAAYAGAYGRRVLQIEYSDNLPEPFDRVCAAPDRAPLTILRDRGLLPAGAPGRVYQQCR